MSTYRISQLADRAGVPATTLRFYEQQGLLPAQRSPAGYRLYGDDDVERLAFIAAGKHLGLPLQEIKDLLIVWESGSCMQVQDQLRPRLREGIAAAQQRALELAAFVVRLTRALEQLEAPARPGRCDPHCSFLQHATRGRRTAEAAPAGTPAGPVACSLSADGQTTQRDLWHDLLAYRLDEQTIDGGLRVTLPADRLAEAAALAAAEQACCPFFDFRLRLDGGVFHLEVRAPAEAAGLLLELMHPTAMAGR